MSTTRSLLLSGVIAASLAANAAAAGPAGATTSHARPRVTARAQTEHAGIITPKPSPVTSCATQVQHRLTTAQKVGQLLMVGITPSQAPGGLDSTITALHLGGVIYLGGWTSGTRGVAATSAHLQHATGPIGTGDVRLFVAADQEGGQVQQLKGSGFMAVPSALSLGRLSPSVITSWGTTVGREMRAAGVNVDLAPVSDTVPAAIGRRNGPIGRFDRQFGYTSAVTSSGVAAFTTGLRSGGVVPTVKHFPGLGRITSNTDTSSTGITDTTATVTDPYLQPFVAGMRAGAGMVMVSSARYPRIDGVNQAVFSRAIVTDLLRGRLGWKGVVVTDDVGAARSVAAVPVGDRATRFVDAGGDIVLTVSASTATVMARALVSRYAASPAFAAKVEAAVGRVLALKQARGLLPCG